MNRIAKGLCALGLAAALLAAASPASASRIKHVIVIAMENEDAQTVYAPSPRKPYIDWLIRTYAHATNFEDELPFLPSEPHYVWMEAGTNEFRSAKFETDEDPSKSNSTDSRIHLTAQIDARPGLTWMTYQEDINKDTGRCPIKSVGVYAAKHNPFVFFLDVSGKAGAPSAEDAPNCARHTQSYDKLAGDVAADRLADYVFITPNLCHDMHGDWRCPNGDFINAADLWLAAELPRLIVWAENHDGVIFITWDQHERQSEDANESVPLIAIGRAARRNHASPVAYDHGSLVKSVEEVFHLPILPSVAAKNDFSDLFTKGYFP